MSPTTSESVDRLEVDPTNIEQARAWDGDEGAFWARHADAFDVAVRDYHPTFMGAAGLAPADRVLDVGCGTGQTTRDAARLAPAGSALGVDLSARMLQVARSRARAEGVGNAEFLHTDAQVHPFGAAAYDVVISRTGAMFFGDPTAAFANLARATRRQGRLVMLTWQPPAANEWIVAFTSALSAGRELPAPPADAPGPFSLSDPDRTRRLLADTGWTGTEVRALEAPMRFGATVDDAHRLVSGLLGWLLDGLDTERRGRALGALRESMQEHLTARGVAYRSAAWLVLARRA